MALKPFLLVRLFYLIHEFNCWRSLIRSLMLIRRNLDKCSFLVPNYRALIKLFVLCFKGGIRVDIKSFNSRFTSDIAWRLRPWVSWRQLHMNGGSVGRLFHNNVLIWLTFAVSYLNTLLEITCAWWVHKLFFSTKLEQSSSTFCKPCSWWLISCVQRICVFIHWLKSILKF
jgi:hypothetical protein